MLGWLKALPDTDSLERLQKAGISDVMGLTIALADIQIAQGQLHEANANEASGSESGSCSHSRPGATAL